MGNDAVNWRNGFAFKYALSCAAATVAESATYPLDLTKTRLQIQGERNAHNRQANCSKYGIVYEKNSINHDNTAHEAAKNSSTKNYNARHPTRGMLKTAVGIVREEGVLHLWQGVTPAVYRHYVYTGIRLTAYEQLREHVFLRNEDGTFPVWKSMCCGVIAGALGQFLASPTDLIKVQMQMEGVRRLQGLPPRVHSTWHAFSTVLSAGGVRGLWAGWLPNVQRAALVNMADLATYDKAKHWLLRHTDMKDNAWTHALSSACSGLAAAVTSTPADVVKTRIMNQPVHDSDGRGSLYKGSMDCLMKTVKAEGVFALYKGFVPIYIRMAPWSLTFWVSYEKIRYFTGASSF